MVMGETLAHHARNTPEELALVFGDHRLTWRELDERANRVGNALREHGAEPGDAALLLLENSVEFVTWYYGLAKIGGVSAPLMPNIVAREAGDIVESLEPAFVVASGDGIALAEAIEDRVPADTHTVGVGEESDLEFDHATFVDSASTEAPDVDVALEDRFTIKFTSGTTGSPKGCVRTHRNFVMAASIALLELPIEADDVGLLVTPLAAGFAVSMLTVFVLRGTTTVLLPEFDSGAYLAAIEREGVTLGTAMEPLLERLFDDPGYENADLGNLRLLHGVGSPEMAAKLQAHETFDADFTAGYASSEAGGLVTFKMPEDFESEFKAETGEFGSLGKEGMLTRVACLDEDYELTPPGEAGQIAVRGPTVFQEYWNRPEKTAEVFENGWYLTGDVGYKDEAGYLYLLGREDDRIESGGMSVYPAEIGRILEARDDVRNVAVVGVPDPEWNERIVACVVPAGETDAETLEAYCREELAAYKRPKQFVFMDSIPKTDVGKIRREELVRRAAEDAKE